MYDENSMKSHIFWIKFRRVFCIILFTAMGSALGAFISSYVVDVLLFPKFWSPIIVVISSILFLSIANIMTANTGKEVQDGYWKIAVYKKLVIISKKLDNLDNLDKLENLEKINTILNPNEEKTETKKVIKKNKEENEQNDSLEKTSETVSSISEEVQSSEINSQENEVVKN